ncbi:MAG: hypothetical protein ABSH56_22250 [Bryobacteraceae bacterium]|jgi:hypothetical protein
MSEAAAVVLELTPRLDRSVSWVSRLLAAGQAAATGKSFPRLDSGCG